MKTLDLFNKLTQFLFPSRKEELYYSLKEMLAFKPHNLSLYRQALLHKSMSEKDEDGRLIDNERLEFLGDAIIEAIVSNYLFHKYTEEQEGFLTTMRSKMVRRNTLNQLSRLIGLDKLVKKSVLNGAHNSYIGGNAFEALVGAVYLDRGYRCCQKFFLSLIERGYLNPDHLEQREENYKSVLLEWCQKRHVTVDFETTQISTSSGSKTPPFVTHVLLEKHSVASGRGFSKKESHQQAAQRALDRLNNRPRVADHVMEERYLRNVMCDLFADLKKSKI